MKGARRLAEVRCAAFLADLKKRAVVLQHLFDETRPATSRSASCYSKCFVDGGNLTPEQIAAQGGNKSLIHID